MEMLRSNEYATVDFSTPLPGSVFQTWKGIRGMVSEKQLTHQNLSGEPTCHHQCRCTKGRFAYRRHHPALSDWNRRICRRQEREWRSDLCQRYRHPAPLHPQHTGIQNLRPTVCREWKNLQGEDNHRVLARQHTHAHSPAPRL